MLEQASGGTGHTIHSLTPANVGSQMLNMIYIRYPCSYVILSLSTPSVPSPLEDLVIARLFVFLLALLITMVHPEVRRKVLEKTVS